MLSPDEMPNIKRISDDFFFIDMGKGERPVARYPINDYHEVDSTSEAVQIGSPLDRAGVLAVHHAVEPQSSAELPELPINVALLDEARQELQLRGYIPPEQAAG